MERTPFLCRLGQEEKLARKKVSVIIVLALISIEKKCLHVNGCSVRRLSTNKRCRCCMEKRRGRSEAENEEKEEGDNAKNHHVHLQVTAIIAHGD
jgi:hypothetical protein